MTRADTIWFFTLAMLADAAVWPTPTLADGANAMAAVRTTVERFCLDCHGPDGAEANINLQEMTEHPDVLLRFKTWQRVAEIVNAGNMPPEDAPQPADDERLRFAQHIDDLLTASAERHAGDPGRVAMRRLTAAEYAYAITDLTDLDLDVVPMLGEDAAGGEGFANVGDVQFVQDSTLEQYLDVANFVASHAVLGAGPLGFYRDRGDTGLELSAIDRIQTIYRQHGFRSAAGEGGEPFGQDHYPRALYVAWQFRHRDHLGAAGKSLAEWAAESHVDTRFAQHIWEVVTSEAASFPLAEIVGAWNSLRAPSGNIPSDLARAETDCHDIADLLRRWQSRLASQAGDDEEAALLTDGPLPLSSQYRFNADLGWPESATKSRVFFSLASASQRDIRDAVVVWRNPIVRFFERQQRRVVEKSLREIVAPEQQSLFGRSPPDNAISMQVQDHDLVIVGAQTLGLELDIPDGFRRARLSVEVELDTAQSGDHIVRCTIADPTSELDTAADRGEVSVLLADPSGEAFSNWQVGASEFARLLPQISHREPAPSDRDPIPAPYDSSYNNAERNDFHYKIKYHRDDRFLVESMLDDNVRVELDQAWHDLLTSFDYHDVYLAFVLNKFQIDVSPCTIETVTSEQIDQMPTSARDVVRRLQENYQIAQAARAASQPGHLEDLLAFASRAWRRPLESPEAERLRDFYRSLREHGTIDHETAIRATLARILVAPAFLYRVETQPADVAETTVVVSSPDAIAATFPLSQWELASRLSFFLWSSPPDEVLLRAAAEHELDSAGLVDHARRMLRHEKGQRFAKEFFGQWFGFYRFDQFRGIDSTRFAELTPQLQTDLYDEAIYFFAHIVRENRPVAEILFADYAFWTNSLAHHYGAANELTSELDHVPQQVTDVTKYHRGGLLQLGAIHAVTSAPLRTSAVKRGDWVLRRVLGSPVPPPPADVGSIPADDVLDDGLSVRERLDAHRQNSQCMNCHSRIDPLGFAMEHFDPIGRWRDEYRDGKPIEASGTLQDGSEIDGIDGLHRYLRTQLGQFHRTLCRKLLGYALGRSELLSDRQLVNSMLDDLAHNAGMSEIIGRIVASEQFRTKRIATADQGG